MTRLIIDAFEMIEIDDGKAKRRAGFISQAFLLLKCGDDISAIEATQQNIALRVFLNIANFSIRLEQGALQALHAICQHRKTRQSHSQHQ